MILRCTAKLLVIVGKPEPSSAARRTNEGKIRGMARAEADAVVAALIAALPETCTVRGVEHIPVGLGNENWIVDTQLGRLVVKIGFSPSSIPKWRAAGRARELAHQAGVRVPRELAFVDRAPELGDRILRVFEFVEGIHPAEILDDPARRQRFFSQLGANVAVLHTIRVEQFGSRLGEPGFDQWSEYVRYRWSQVRARSTNAGLAVDFLDRVEPRLLETAAELNEAVRPTVVHRDLHLDNLLADRDGNLAAILDFDQAEAWEPMADLLKLQWWTFDRYPGSAAAFESAYFSSSTPLVAYEQRHRVLELLENTSLLANIQPGQETEAALARDRLELALTS